MSIILNCKNCKKDFKTFLSLKDRKKYCSSKCYYTIKPRKSLICKCGKKFIVLFARRNIAKYCSFYCSSKYKKGSYITETNPSYEVIHSYVHKKLDKNKPKKCQHCKEIKKLDLASKSQKYKKNLKDWLWLCRKCHIIYDKISERRITRVKKNCLNCKKEIFAKKCQIERKKYCSRTCLGVYMNKHKLLNNKKRKNYVITRK